MAVTRINNNQISNPVNGNAYLGINAASKIQSYTITSTKLANSLVYGSDLTVSGNLTVNGTTTTIDTVNTLIQDPILTLADGQTAGTPTLDIGLLGLRGNQNSSFIGWKESATEFVVALSNTLQSNTTANINSYANFHANSVLVGGNLSVAGNVTGTLNVTSNVVANNISSINSSTSATYSASGNITGGNVLTGGIMSSTGNATHGNVLTGGIVSATGNITTAGYFVGTFAGSISGNVTAAGSNTQIQYNNGGNLGASSAFTFNTATNVLTNSGNTSSGNLLTGGLVSATATITGGNLATGGTASATGNITGGNVLTAGLISATSTITSAANITGGNILTGGLISSTGNITTAATVNTATVRGATGVTVSTGSGNINLSPTTGNIVINATYINGVSDPVQTQDVATKAYVDNMSSSGIAYHQPVAAATVANSATTTGGTTTYTQPNGVSNGVGAYISTTGSWNLVDTANIQTANTRVLVKNEANAVWNGVYYWANATTIVRTTDADSYGPDSTTDLSVNDYFYTTGGNVNAGTAFIVSAPAGTITFGTSNIQFSTFSTSQVYSGNTAAGISLVGTVINAKVDSLTTAFDGSGNISVKASAQLTTPNIGAATGTSLSTTGTVTAGNLATGGTASATGNITGGNVLTAGLMSSTGNATHGNVLTGGIVSATGNVTGNYFIGNGSQLTGVTASTSGFPVTAGTSNIAAATNGNIGITIGATSNVGLFTTSGLVVTGLISANGNVTSGNVLTGGLISATATVTGGNLATGGTASATGNITGGNILTGGLVSATGTGTFGNVVLSGNNINQLNANSIIGVNGAQANTNTAIYGQNNSNPVFFVNALSNTASFGNSTQTTNAIVAFNASTSVVLPAGNTAQRPGTGVTGMVRFNSTLNSLELYNNSAWTTVGATVFTVIADDQFNGDGTTVAFTLTSSQTTNSCIVSINGVVQIPTTAYSVSGTTLTFTEAPAVGDLIDVREITTTTTVTSLSNASGNAIIAASATAAQIDLTGNLIPVANATANIGNATNQFNTIFAKATSAQYADLAEMYAADAAYAPGTVVSFGGANEVTQSKSDADRAVAGVVSTNPSYIMNAGQAGDNVVAVALTGRVPTSVTGTVAKGDLMVSNGDGTARAEADPKVGTVIGKALADFDGTTGTIEVVVGRF